MKPRSRIITSLISGEPDLFWRRNLAVCLFGSFTTVFALAIILPFLPIFVTKLGVRGHAAIVQWSGIAYGAAFVTAGLLAPLWGHLGDRYGRKAMLLRASLGMAIAMSLTGFAANIWQLVGLRLLTGILGGYASAATILIAIQAPKKRAGWALGVLSSGIMTGYLLGPLAGGVLPSLVGIRATFWCAGALIFVAFLATAIFIREVPHQSIAGRPKRSASWSDIPRKGLVVTMLGTGLLLMVANMSIEPIITIYVATLVQDPGRVTFIAGITMSAAAFGSIVSSSHLGKIADRVGQSTVIVFSLSLAGLLLIPQAFVTTGWQLIGLRFLMGLALGSVLPSIAAVVRHNVPEHLIGSVMGYSVSSQFAGQVVGPLIGGFIGGRVGMRAVFLGTSFLLLMGALVNWRAKAFYETSDHMFA